MTNSQIGAVIDEIATLRSELDQAEVMERLDVRDGDLRSAAYWHKVAERCRADIEAHGVAVYLCD